MGITELEEEIVTRLRPLNPDKIILFGSFAYGTPDSDSDLDICLVMDTDMPKIKLKRQIRSLLQGITIAKDILTPSSSEYKFYCEEYGSVYRQIHQKGKVLWQNS
jgi:predicted nucleotidyltransferase